MLLVNVHCRFQIKIYPYWKNVSSGLQRAGLHEHQMQQSNSNSSSSCNSLSHRRWCVREVKAPSERIQLSKKNLHHNLHQQ